MRIQELNGLLAANKEAENNQHKEVFDLSGIIKQSPNSIDLYEES